jgi:predicted DNA-binding transcriptional regulator AlpA
MFDCSTNATNEGAAAVGETYLTAPDVLRRFTISDTTLYTWIRDPRMGFPQPIVFNRRRRFLLCEIAAFERDCADRRTAPRAA